MTLSALRLLLLTAACAAPSLAFATDLTVSPTGPEPVVVVLDGKVLGAAPITVPNVNPGPHELGFRASQFAQTAFTEKITVPASGALEVKVNWQAQTVTAAAAQAPAAPAAPAAASTPAPAPAAGDLFVATDTPGAKVLLDGADTGQVTPALLKGVSPGPHKVEARTPCARSEATVKVAKDLIARADMTLVPGDGAIEITSEPKGAQVVVEGKEVGPTPYSASKVACGDHSFTVRAPGYLQASQVVTTPAFEVTKVHVVLEKERFGTLVISPTPVEAAVALDGVGLGAGPRTVEQVGAGPHTLRVELDGYTPSEQPITVTPDEITRIDVALSAVVVEEERSNTGRIALNSAVTAGGVGLLSLGTVSYLQARKAFQFYLSIDDDTDANTFYDVEVLPRRRLAVISGAGGAALLGAGVGLWVTSDLALAPAPGGAVLVGRF